MRTRVIAPTRPTLALQSLSTHPGTGRTAIAEFGSRASPALATIEARPIATDAFHQSLGHRRPRADRANPVSDSSGYCERSSARLPDRLPGRPDSQRTIG